jgi:hypothetical protein
MIGLHEMIPIPNFSDAAAKRNGKSIQLQLADDGIVH